MKLFYAKKIMVASLYSSIFTEVKKVLILAYDFPPYVSVGGLRPFNWYQYFNEFGIQPIVVTRQWSNEFGNYRDYISKGTSDNTIIEETIFGTILRTPYSPNLANKLLLRFGEKRFKYLRKLLSAFYEFGQFVLPIGTKRGLYLGARDYLRNHKVDAVIATGDPFILFKYARQLSDEFDIPWIADYRDPWSRNMENKRNFLQRYFYHFQEKRNVRSAAHITTVSSFVESKIRKAVEGPSISILPNGYDPDAIHACSSIVQNKDRLTLSFVGTIYPWHPLEQFLRTLERFIQQESADILIKFYGTNKNDHINELIREKFPKLLPHVQVIPKMPNLDLLIELSKDNVMLLFNYYSYMGTKIFDYLGIKRQMLLCFYDDPKANELKLKYYRIHEDPNYSNQLQAALMKETNSGIIVKDADHLITVINDLHREFESTGQIACDSIGVENYSRKIQVEKLAEIIKGIS